MILRVFPPSFPFFSRGLLRSASRALTPNARKSGRRRCSKWSWPRRSFLTRQTFGLWVTLQTFEWMRDTHKSYYISISIYIYIILCIYIYMYIWICLITEYLHVYAQVLYLREGIKMGIGLPNKLPPILWRGKCLKSDFVGTLNTNNPHSHEIPNHVSVARNRIIRFSGSDPHPKKIDDQMISPAVLSQFEILPAIPGHEDISTSGSCLVERVIDPWCLLV